MDRALLKQQTKQVLRRTVGEPFVGKRSKLRRFERVLPGLDLHPADVLDVGSEDATFIYWLADRWPEATVTAVDIDAAAIDACLRARPAAYADRVDFRVAALADLPAESYDVVTAFDVLEHITDDADAVRDVYRALRPGGRFLVHVPRDVWIDAHGHEERVPDEEAWRINAGHVRMGYSPDGLTRLLRDAGFDTDPPLVWLQRWSVRAFWLYFKIEPLVPLRLLTIPFTDLAARLDERRPQEEGNTVYVVGTKPVNPA
jgi:SAM-dependent methyltransferase